MAENNTNTEIPEDADKILFAEDLIRIVMLRKGSAPYYGWRAGTYRQFTYNGFNGTTEKAVSFIYRNIANGYPPVFQHMKYRNAVNREMYTKIAINAMARFFPSRFLARKFLHFCVHVAIVGDYFYTNGVPEALDLAVQYIVRPMKDIDMTTGGWDSLNSSAQSFAKMARDSLKMFRPVSVNSAEDILEAGVAPESDRGVPVADNLVAVPGEANLHASQNYTEIPEDADKILFAEDLIRAVMLLRGSAPYSGWRAGPYRQFTYNGFNGTAEKAVSFMYRNIANGYPPVFQHMQNINAVNREMYTKIANNAMARFFPARFIARKFLHFCVHVAILGDYFYANGVPEALDLAVQYIVRPMKDIDMTTGGWDSLNRSAQMHAIVARDSMDTFPPESVNSAEDFLEAGDAPESDGCVPVADYAIAVPGEADLHAAQDYTGSDEENIETEDDSIYD